LPFEPSALVANAQRRDRCDQQQSDGKPAQTSPHGRGRGSASLSFRCLSRGRWLHRRDKPVAAARQRLDESRILSRVAERFAQLPDCVVQSDIEIDERLGRPEMLPELLARDDFTWTGQQEPQNLKGLFRKPHLQAVSAQFTGLRVELEDAEADNSGGRGGFHGDCLSWLCGRV
jgi:hypothetical protein